MNTDDLCIINGVVTKICYTTVAGRAPLTPHELHFFDEIVSARADDIIAKWIDFFVMHKPIKSETITRRFK
ncbi:hypothetical protein [Thiospirillum jenense]|uniref:Uncharacterized protein n=1 Tax=Thiospirillum jenense TaxID=1653858 RepID=A0A839HM89_9GAMM|nr:hypothetical protein [Thiospirillum jenense]MBB1127349.1 hypothetical protein [Thiospirillum jenense]